MRDERTAIGRLADEGLFGRPLVVRDDIDFVAVFVDQANHLALVGQSVADAPVIGIDGDGESRRLAATKEDNVRVGSDDRAVGELEVFVWCRAVAQSPTR